METTTPMPPTLGGFFHRCQRYFLANQAVGDSGARRFHCATGTGCGWLIRSVFMTYDWCKAKYVEVA